MNPHRAHAVVLATMLSAAAPADTLAADAPASDPLAPFHAPSADERRSVIALPPADDESALQVELLVGRVLTVDCNARNYIGKMERKSLLRRNVYYYTARDLALPVLPLPHACPENEPVTQRFVHLQGDPYFVPYDSRTPIVVYTPPEFEVRYRVWRAGEEIAAPAGG